LKKSCRGTWNQTNSKSLMKIQIIFFLHRNQLWDKKRRFLKLKKLILTNRIFYEKYTKKCHYFWKNHFIIDVLANSVAIFKYIKYL
jgi:hypothetical protein